MKNYRRIIAVALLPVLLFVFAGFASAAAPTDGPAAEPFEIPVRSINKHGNVILETSFEAMQARNIAAADIVTVDVAGYSYNMPVGTSHSDVDAGEMMLRFDAEDNEVSLTINSESFAELTGIAVKETVDEEPGYRWDIRIGAVTVALKEKGGYRKEYAVRHLERSNERSDYSELSGADFANCRAIPVSGKNTSLIHRGSTPLDPDIGRNTYAMAYIEENGIKSVLNLTDSVEQMQSYDSYEGSYYASCRVLNVEMGYDFGSDEFDEKVLGCVRFMLEADAPFFIHCKEGKDRTGILCAILECLLGASYEDIKNDYMKTYINFFRVEEGSETYSTILDSNIVSNLCFILGLYDPENADLRASAEEYLLSIGLTEKELSDLTSKLS